MNTFLKLIKVSTILCIIALLSVVYCYHNNQFWTHLNTDTFEALAEYKGENVKCFRGKQILVHKEFIPKLSNLDIYAQRNNVTIIINQSYRYKGQKVRGVVRQSTMSNHEAGCGIDFNVVYRNKKYFSHELQRSNLDSLPKDIQHFIRDIRKDKQLRWGGDFNTQDPIHVDCPVNLNNRNLWVSYSKACNNDFTNAIPKWKFWIT
jgi:hypothetical protein